MLDQKQLHQKILYPVVRVRTTKAGGSGTIIYSKPCPTHPDEYQSFVLTCAHVISDAIQVKPEWDGLLKKEIRKEFVEQVQTEVFDYVYLSKVNSSNAYRADIIAYDKSIDLAVLRVDTPKILPYTATLVPKGNIDNIKVFDGVYTSGCSLGHDPIINKGQVTYLTERIDNKLYLMANSSSIFGNSGGALFLEETGEQVGVTARITSIQLGFGVDIITWMGFSVSPQEIYKFIDSQELQFLYDPKDTFEASTIRREKKQKEALRAFSKDDKEESDEEEPFSLREGI